MAYKVKGKKGLPVKIDGKNILGSIIPEVKISELNESDMSFLAVGSDEKPDRDEDIVRVSGWDLKNFKKNPVIPWSHNYYDPPVGKAVMIKVDKEQKRLVFRPKFDKNDEKAKMIFDKYKNGFLKTFSVGFIGKEFTFRDENNRYYGGREFTGQELLEISSCTIPCNPGANVDLLGLGVDSDIPDNLVQLGFSQHFKNENGLYFPVKDVELYTDPNTIEFCRGIKGIFAKHLNDPDGNSSVVAYLFDDALFTEKSAGIWVNENSEQKQVSVYYELKFSDDGAFELSTHEEEVSTNKVEVLEEDVVDEAKNETNGGVKDETDNGTVVDSDDNEIPGDGDIPKATGENSEVPAESIEPGSIGEKIENLNTLVKNLETVVDTMFKKVIASLSKSGDNTPDAIEELSENESTDKSQNDDLIAIANLLSPDNKGKKDQSIEVDISGFLQEKNVGKDVLEKTLKEVLSSQFKTILDEFSGKIS